MLLSKLVYLTIKNAIYFDDASFTFLTFKQGLFDQDSNYAKNINNVFTPINEAIARLSDLEKIPYCVEEVEIKDITNSIIDLAKFSRSPKQVISIAQMYKDGSYRVLEWRPFGLNKIRIVNGIDCMVPVVVEFKEDIPQFDEESFSYLYEDEVEECVKDMELKDFGISDTMCNFIMEYAMGKLTEPDMPELANMHITRSEQYFNNIASVLSAFPQKVVRNKFRIGE